MESIGKGVCTTRPGNVTCFRRSDLEWFDRSPGQAVVAEQVGVFDGAVLAGRRWRFFGVDPGGLRGASGPVKMRISPREDSRRWRSVGAGLRTDGRRRAGGEKEANSPLDFSGPKM